MSRSSCGWLLCPVHSCRKRVSLSGWARTSHFRMHVRRGEMKEVVAHRSFVFDRWVGAEFHVAVRVKDNEDG